MQYSYAAKMVMANHNVDYHGLKWLGAKRIKLIINEDEIITPDWVMDVVDVENAKLAKVKTAILGIRGHILSIPSEDGVYHFGLNYNPHLMDRLPFKVTYDEYRLKLSMVSLVMRMVVVVLFAYYLYRSMK